MTTPSTHERIPAFTIGDRLRKAREKTGLRQDAFAEDIGVSRGTVSNYEAATSDEGMKRAFLAQWAMRADVPLDWLLTGRGEQGKPPEGGDRNDLRRLTEAKKVRSRGRGVSAADTRPYGLDRVRAA